MNRVASLFIVFFVIVVAARGQVIKPSPGKVLSDVTSWSVDSERVLDMAVDAAGNQYCVGQTTVGSHSDGFVVKLSKRGVLQWQAPIDLGSTEASTAVAVDADNHVYVATVVGANVQKLQKYAASGELLWTSSAMLSGVTYAGTITDLGVDSQNRPIACGTIETTPGTPLPVVERWSLSGGGIAAAYSFGTTPGVLTSLAIDASDRVFCCGSKSNGTGAMTVTAANWSSATLYVRDNPSFNDYFREIRVCPDTNCAVAVGSAVNPTTGEKQGCLATLAPNGNGYTSMEIEPGGCSYVGIDIAPDNSIYLAFAVGLQSGPKFAFITKYRADPNDAWIISQWSDYAPDLSETDALTPYDVVTAPDSSAALIALSERTIGAGTKAFQGYQVFTWAPDGTREDRLVLGSKLLQIPTSYDPVTFATHTAAFSGDQFTLHAGLRTGHSGMFTGLFSTGPGESYTGTEDKPLVVALAKSVLINDGDQFTLLPLSAQYFDGSASEGLASVDLHPDGTFTATPVADFFGNATFRYNVIQNGLIIRTNTVTLTFKGKNDAPVAHDDSLNVAKNSATVNLDVLANDFDVDGDHLQITGVGADSHAAIAIAGNKKTLTFKPKHGFTGAVTFDYTVKDPSGESSTATVTVTVT